jgi:hypothetical protein
MDDEEKAGHPWTLTYKELLDRVCSVYGFRLYQSETVDPWGRLIELRYLKSIDGVSIVHLPANMELETRLNEHTTGSLCRRLGIPPEDFGLYPEE